MSSLDYKLYDIMDEMSKDHRWDVLTILILRGNKRNRCWPAMRTIAKKACPGKTKKSAGNMGIATRAKKWLMEHGAITLVKPEHRIGAEKKLARNRHVYQMTGVIVIDGKVYPYLYSPGRDHVSGGETTGDEDVSGAETSGAETSGAETSGAETNHSSVESGISSDQESGKDSSSSKGKPDEDFGLSDKELSIVSEAFGGSVTTTTKQLLEKDCKLTFGWSEYALATRRCYDDDDPCYVRTPSRYIWDMVSKGENVPELPVESDAQRKTRDTAEERAKFTDAEWAAKLKDDELQSDKEHDELLERMAKDKIEAATDREKQEYLMAREKTIHELRSYMADQEKRRLAKIEEAARKTKAEERVIAQREKDAANHEKVLAMIDARRSANGLPAIENTDSINN